MFNLLRMDLYRIKRGKAIYGCLAFLLATIFLCYGMIYMTATPEGQEVAFKIGMDQLVVRNEITGEILPPDSGLLEGISSTEMIRKSFMDGGAYALILGILTALFLCGDFQSGFVKNIMAVQRNRWKYVISKMFTMGILNFCYLVICFAFGLALNVLFHELVPFSPIKQLLFYLVWAWLVTTAFAALIILICVMTRNAAVGVMAAILLGSGLVSLPVRAFLSLFHADGWMDYTIYYNIAYGPSSYQTVADLRAVVMGVIFLLLYGGLSVMMLSKQDI